MTPITFFYYALAVSGGLFAAGLAGIVLYFAFKSIEGWAISENPGLASTEEATLPERTFQRSVPADVPGGRIVSIVPFPQPPKDA